MNVWKWDRKTRTYTLGGFSVYLNVKTERFEVKNQNGKIYSVSFAKLETAQRCAEKKMDKLKGECKMKEYMVTCFGEEYAVHKHIGGGAYCAVFFGTHNDVVKYFKDNGITEYGVGH